MKRTAVGIFADDDNLIVVNVGVDYRQDIGMAARLFPQHRFTLNGLKINLFAVEQLDGKSADWMEKVSEEQYLG